MMFDYIGFAIALVIVVLFYKIGDLDDDLNPIFSMGVGGIVAGLQFLYPGGWLRLGFYILLGIAILTAYKLILHYWKGRDSQDAPPSENSGN